MSEALFTLRKLSVLIILHIIKNLQILSWELLLFHKYKKAKLEFRHLFFYSKKVICKPRRVVWLSFCENCENISVQNPATWCISQKEFLSEPYNELQQVTESPPSSTVLCPILSSTHCPCGWKQCSVFFPHLCGFLQGSSASSLLWTVWRCAWCPVMDWLSILGVFLLHTQCCWDRQLSEALDWTLN